MDTVRLPSRTLPESYDFSSELRDSQTRFPVTLLLRVSQSRNELTMHGGELTWATRYVRALCPLAEPSRLLSWRLEGINIYLGEHGNTNHRFIENSMVAHDIAVPQTTPLLIPINATGRYLFVRKLTAGGYYSGLSLCEIEVFGEANA